MRILFLTAILLPFLPATSIACEDFVDLTVAEMKEYRDKLKEADADPFDRLFAFEQLSCSSDPTVRNIAIKLGLQNSKDSLVRNKIVLEATMQLKRLDIQLKKPQKNNSLYENSGGVLSNEIRYRNASEGCLGWASRDSCEGYYFSVSGDKAILQGNGYDGAFEFTEANQFIGYVRYNRERLDATIDLF